MSLIELKRELTNNKLRPHYIFTGEEVEIMSIYIDKIVEIQKGVKSGIDTVSEIYQKMQNKSLILNPSCYVIRNDREYLKQEKIWKNIADGKLQGKNIIILIYDTLDRRSKFYKQYQDSIIEFEKLDSTLLAKYVRKEINLKPDSAKHLSEICDNDYSRILLECDKIKHLAQSYNIDEEQAYIKALLEKLIHEPAKDRIFDFINAICSRQIEESFKLLVELKAVSDSPLGALSLLYSTFRSMLLVQSSTGTPKEIEKVTGLTYWQIKTAQEKGGKYSVGELVTILKHLKDLEQGMKMGRYEAQEVLDLFLIAIF